MKKILFVFAVLPMYLFAQYSIENPGKTITNNSAQNTGLSTVVDIIVDSPDHESLEAAVIAAGLASTLSGDGPFTVFAPTDAAFAALGSDVIDELFADPTGALANILKHHVYGGLAMSSDLVDDMTIPVLYGNDLNVMFTSDGGIMLDNANIVLTAVDLPADNGTVHVIDAVLNLETTTDIISYNTDKDHKLYTIDLLGKIIDDNNIRKGSIVFDIYESGKVDKKMIF